MDQPLSKAGQNLPPISYYLDWTSGTENQSVVSRLYSAHVWRSMEKHLDIWALNIHME